MLGGPRHDQRHQPGQLRVRGPGHAARGHACTCAHNTSVLPEMHVLPGTDTLLCTLSQPVLLPPTCTYLQDPQPWQVCHFHPLSFRWRAGNHSAFWGMTLDEGIRYRLGTNRPPSSVINMNEIHVSPFLPTMLPTPHGLEDPHTLCLIPPRAWAYPSPLGCISLDESLPFSEPSVLAHNEMCCTTRTDALILNVVVPA